MFVGNIAERVQKHDLRADFEKFGRVHEVFIAQGYGFITFEDPRCASKAVEVSFILFTGSNYLIIIYFCYRIWTAKVMLAKG